MLKGINEVKRKNFKDSKIKIHYELSLVEDRGQLYLTNYGEIYVQVKDLGVINKYILKDGYYITNISKLREYNYLKKYLLTSKDIQDINNLIIYGKTFNSLKIIRVEKAEEWVSKRILLKKDIYILKDAPFYMVILENDTDMIVLSEYILKVNDNSNLKFTGMIENIYIDNLDISRVTNLAYMFHNLVKTKKIVLENFDTKNVRSFKGMFEGCINLLSINVVNLITDRATDLSRMFAQCVKLKELDLNHFKIDNVRYFDWMFSNCINLEYLYIDTWDFDRLPKTEKLFFDYMFNGCIRLKNLNKNQFYRVLNNKNNSVTRMLGE